jgi:DNA repair protein RadA/Sms
VLVADISRQKTGITEFDRVLGGGLVPGSGILVGGEPGIGKSTLLLQVAGLIAQQGTPALYVSGEESDSQIAMRARRLGLADSGILLLAHNDVYEIEACLSQQKPGLTVIDSIQTLYNNELTSPPGSVSQVRDCGVKLVNLAKERGCVLLLVGHITKEGSLAGPKVLEHLVDVVLYMEGERYSSYRVLRATKNRFGSSSEIGIFEMMESGLIEVQDPSHVLLSPDAATAPGSVVAAAVEGERPLLLELQALVAPATYSQPQRVSRGYDNRRLAVLLAVLERRVGLKLSNRDVFLNIAGGIRVEEPGVDLAAAMAIYSSLKNVPILESTVAIGEVGLAGEIRPVAHEEKRVKEAAKLGFKRIIVPKGRRRPISQISGIDLAHVSSLVEAVDKTWPKE